MISSNFVRHYMVAILASIALLAGCDNTPSTIKIGVAQPLSGNLGVLGQDLLNGVKLAAEELNKDGFRIRNKLVRIEIVAMDDRSDPAEGVKIANQMVEAGVVAVIGNLNSGVSIPAAPVYAAHNIAQLSMSTSPKFTELGLSNTFRLIANDNLQARAMGSFAAKQLNAAKFAVIDDGTGYGSGLASGAAAELKKAGKEIVLRESFDNKTKEFDNLAAKLKANQVDAVVSTLNDFQMSALLEALKKIDHVQLSILGANNIKTTAMLKGIGMVKNLYATSPIVNAKEFPAGKNFLDNYRAVFKIDPAYGSHYTYDAMYVLAAAMKRAESADPIKIMQTLRTLDAYAPVTGSMKWDAVGEQRYGVVGVYSARAGDWELQVRSDLW